MSGVKDRRVEHTSWTQLSMFRKCPKQWEFRYIKGLKRPPGGAMIIGGATHEGLEVDLKEKKKTGKNLKTKQAVGAYLASFDEKVESNGGKSEVEWSPDEPYPKAKDNGARAFEHYHKLRSPELDPTLVEAKFELTMGKYLIHGVIDVAESDNSLVDFKTGSRKKPENFAYMSDQLGMYQLAKPDASELRYEVILRYKTKEDFQIIQRPPLSKPELTILKENIVDTVDAMDKGALFRADPDSCWWCSPKWCGYWDKCRGRK